MKVVRINGDRALAVLGEVSREVGIALVPEVRVGDFVVVHAGFAMQALNEQEALATLETFRDMGLLTQIELEALTK